MKPHHMKERFVELRAEGFSYDSIAKRLKVSKQTLVNWSKELELDIANLKAMRLETLQEKYYMTKERRIELFGNRLEAIRKELEKRDLADVPTGRLFDLLMRCSDVLEGERTDLEFRQERGIADIDLRQIKFWKA